MERIDTNRRKGLVGTASLFLSSLLPKKLLGKDRGAKENDQVFLNFLREKAQASLDKYYFNFPGANIDEVETSARTYGSAYRKFDDEHGIDSDIFTGIGKEIKNNFFRWLSENKNADYKIRQEKFNKMVADLKKAVYTITNDREDEAVTAYLNNFFCGYNNDYCQYLM